MINKSEKEIMEKWRSDNMTDPFVSIKCNAYNHGRYISQCLDGILMQKTDFRFQIVVHDDASTDNTAEIIRQYETLFPNIIHAIYEQENQYSKHDGSIGRIMKEACCGKYIAICEGDDYWIDELKLQKQIDYLEQHPECTIVYSNILPVDKNGHYVEEFRGIYPLLLEGDYTKHEIEECLIKTQSATACYRNLYHMMSPQDYDYYLGVKCNGDLKNLIYMGFSGKAHYLADVTAAHRRVFDEGDSYTARVSRQDPFISDCTRLFHFLEACRLMKHFFHRNKYLWNRVILSDNETRKKYGKSVLETDSISKYLHRSNIPAFAYVVFALYLVKVKTFSVVRKVVH